MVGLADKAGNQGDLSMKPIATLAAIGILAGGFAAAPAAAQEQCPRGALDSRFCDRNGDLVADTPLRVTQGRSIYRAAQHRIVETFVSARPGVVDPESVFGLVFDLAFGLELVEVSEESRLRLTRKGERWHETDLAEKVRAIYTRFLEERLPDGRDFHVRRLRRAVAAALAERPGDAWLPLDRVPFEEPAGFENRMPIDVIFELRQPGFDRLALPSRVLLDVEFKGGIQRADLAQCRSHCITAIKAIAKKVERVKV